jgi:hypothetical protein
MAQAVEARTPEELSTDTTLPAPLVHKRGVDQVFVTDWMRGPGNENLCTIAAQLPLVHARYSDTAAPYHDIVLLAETIRQAGIVVASEMLGVPPDRQFLLRELRVDIDPLDAARKTPDTTRMTVFQDASSTIKMRPGRTLMGGMMRARFSIAGQEAGICEVMGAWVPDHVYEGMRGDKLEADKPPPTPRDQVESNTGKRNPDNAVITPLQAGGAPRAYEASLYVDTSDPTFFDHPLDHVPGLLMLEAMQQVAVAGACRELGSDPARVVVSSFRMKFSRIAEFQPDVSCSVTLDEGVESGEVVVAQSGKPCCSGTVGITQLP